MTEQAPFVTKIDIPFNRERSLDCAPLSYKARMKRLKLERSVGQQSHNAPERIEQDIGQALCCSLEGRPM